MHTTTDISLLSAPAAFTSSSHPNIIQHNINTTFNPTRPFVNIHAFFEQGSSHLQEGRKLSTLLPEKIQHSQSVAGGTSNSLYLFYTTMQYNNVSNQPFLKRVSFN